MATSEEPELEKINDELSTGAERLADLWRTDPVFDENPKDFLGHIVEDISDFWSEEMANQGLEPFFESTELHIPNVQKNIDRLRQQIENAQQILPISKIKKQKLHKALSGILHDLETLMKEIPSYVKKITAIAPDGVVRKSMVQTAKSILDSPLTPRGKKRKKSRLPKAIEPPSDQLLQNQRLFEESVKGPLEELLRSDPNYKVDKAMPLLYKMNQEYGASVKPCCVEVYGNLEYSELQPGETGCKIWILYSVAKKLCQAFVLPFSSRFSHNFIT